MTIFSPIRLDPDVPLEIWPDFPESEIASGTRASIGYRWIEDREAGIVAGIWEAEPNLGRWMRWPVHEFMVIVEGEVVMVEDSCETVISAGNCFYIPKGRRCIWNQAEYAKKIMFILDDMTALPEDSSHPILKVGANDASLVTISKRGEHLYNSVPVETEIEQYRDPSGRLSIGVWTSNRFDYQVESFSRDEFFYLLEGELTLVDEAGAEHIFNAGDAFIIRLGTRVIWKSIGIVRSIYCGFSPRKR